MANKYVVVQPAADDLPANAAHGFLKRNSGNTGWEQVAFEPAPANLGTTAAEGTANSVPRGDHVHDLPESVVRTVLTELTADPAFNSRKLTLVADPTSAQDAATKAYVDAAAAGARDPKDAVVAATFAALPAHTRTGNVLTASANGVLPQIDGVTLVVTDRVLVNNAGTTTGADRGLYFVSAVGSAVAPWTMTRVTDADSSAEVSMGLFVYVVSGAQNQKSGWLLTTVDPITLNTTTLSFTQVSGLGDVTAGSGLTKTGNQLDVGAGNGIQINADSVEALYNTPSVTQDAAGAAQGTANFATRSDHKHAYDMGMVGDVLAVGASAAAGTSLKFPRADHVHAHGQLATGNMHAVASDTVNGFMAATDKGTFDDFFELTALGTVATADATITQAATIGTADNKTVIAECIVAARRTDVAGTAGAFKLAAAFRRGVGAGTLVQIGSTTVLGNFEDVAGLDATLDADTATGNIRCRVTGIAAQSFSWSARMQAASV